MVIVRKYLILVNIEGKSVVPPSSYPPLSKHLHGGKAERFSIYRTLWRNHLSPVLQADQAAGQEQQSYPLCYATNL